MSFDHIAKKQAEESFDCQFFC